MGHQQTNPDDASSGLVAGLAGVARNMAGLLLCRLELAALELGQVRDNVAKLVFIGAVGVLALLFAVGCWTALVIVLAWESMGWKILLLVAAGYSLLAAAVFMYARSMLAQGKLSMAATAEELRKDRDALLQVK